MTAVETAGVSLLTDRCLQATCNGLTLMFNTELCGALECVWPLGHSRQDVSLQHTHKHTYRVKAKPSININSYPFPFSACCHVQFMVLSIWGNGLIDVWEISQPFVLFFKIELVVFVQGYMTSMCIRLLKCEFQLSYETAKDIWQTQGKKGPFFSFKAKNLDAYHIFFLIKQQQ